MTYITQKARVELKGTGDAAVKRQPSTPGELNYLITSLLKGYIDHKGLKYDTINDVIGALEGAKLEFYRRVAVPYEYVTLSVNGDVYGGSHD